MDANSEIGGNKKMPRREFLKLLAGGAVATAIAACDSKKANTIAAVEADATAQAKEGGIKKTPEYLLKSAVKIQFVNEKDEIKDHCTGTAVKAKNIKGYATADHCLVFPQGGLFAPSRAKAIRISQPQIDPNKYIEYPISKMGWATSPDINEDYAVIVVPDNGELEIVPVEIDINWQPQIGTQIEGLTFPILDKGAVPLYTRTKISADPKDLSKVYCLSPRLPNQIAVDDEFVPGSSGGGMFVNKKLVGIEVSGQGGTDRDTLVPYIQKLTSNVILLFQQAYDMMQKKK